MEDPGAAGIPPGQELSYVVNVYEDVMHLEFSTAGKPTKTFKINLADNVDGVSITNAAPKTRLASGTPPALVQAIGPRIKPMAITPKRHSHGLS